MTTSRHDLFAVPPEEFVATRDRLARELRAGGDKEEAAAVKRLRRPTIPVWALNQVGSIDPQAVRELIAAADDARTAQHEVLEGADADLLRSALARRREAISAVARSARRIVEDSGRPGDAQARDIENALHTVVGSPALTADLARAELAGLDADDEADATLFAGSLSSVDDTATAARKPRRGTAPTARARPAPSRRLVEAREKLERQKGEAAEAAERMREAERAVTDAEAAAKRADHDLAVARRALGAARDAQERADAAVARTEDAVARLDA